MVSRLELINSDNKLGDFIGAKSTVLLLLAHGADASIL